MLTSPSHSKLCVMFADTNWENPVPFTHSKTKQVPDKNIHLVNSRKILFLNKLCCSLIPRISRFTKPIILASWKIEIELLLYKYHVQSPICCPDYFYNQGVKLMHIMGTLLDNFLIKIFIFIKLVNIFFG